MPRSLWIRCASLVLSVTASGAAAQLPRTSVIATGDCRDLELFASARILEMKLGEQGAASLLSEAEILQRIGREPSNTAEELQRQIDTAQQQFYQARYTRAIKQLEGALQEIARLTPGPKRWQLEVSARLLEGLIRTRLQGDTSSEDAFARVLRLDPGYKLDPDFFGPSTIERFERVRQRIATAPRHALEITSSPPGAEVFVDGRPMGRTPHRASLPEGSYQLLVGKDGALSIHREVRLPWATSAHVDLQFEAAVRWRRALCLADARDPATRQKNAVKLGSLLDADQLVLLRIQQQRQGAIWLTATLLSVSRAQRIREGGLRLEREVASDSELAELARFVITGEQMPRVIPTPSAIEALPRIASADVPLAPGSPVGSPSTPEAVKQSASPTSFLGEWRRPAAFVAGGMGAVATATGIAFLFSTSHPRSELETLLENGLSVDEAPRARVLVDEHASRRSIGLLGIGVGAAALACGTLLYLLDNQAEGRGYRLQVAAAASSHDGVAVSLGGAF